MKLQVFFFFSEITESNKNWKLFKMIFKYWRKLEEIVVSYKVLFKIINIYDIGERYHLWISPRDMRHS